MSAIKVRYYLTALSLVVAVTCMGAWLSVPRQSNYVKWASWKYPKEARNVNVETTMKSYGVLDIFKTVSDTDTIKAMGVVWTLHFAESQLPLTDTRDNPSKQ